MRQANSGLIIRDVSPPGANSALLAFHYEHLPHNEAHTLTSAGRRPARQCVGREAAPSRPWLCGPRARLTRGRPRDNVQLRQCDALFAVSGISVIPVSVEKNSRGSAHGRRR